MPSEPVIGPVTLGFDTSAALCAAAVVSGGRCLAARADAMATGQAERLMPLLEEVLAEAGLGWGDLGALGVGIGPGNFTGVRISVATARGLALALGIPAVGVALTEARGVGLPSPVAVIEDVRRGQVALALDGPPRLVTPEQAAEIVGALPLTGSAAPAVAALTGGTVLAPALPLAEAIARIAAARAGTPQPRPAPLYLRPADAAPPSEAPPALLE